MAGEKAPLVVVGGGAAGLFCALCALRAGAAVVLVSAGQLAQTASYWAQGGLAAAVGPDDAPALHQADTERAGRNAVRPAAAALLAREAPARLAELVALGVPFDRDRKGDLLLGLEGGHSRRRIVHGGGSQTGQVILQALAGLLGQYQQLTVVEGKRAVGLLVAGGRCAGVVVEDGRELLGRAVVLACGGAAALYARTTNPPGSLGVGLLLALRVGAALADLELLQFHPTAVSGVPGREGFLISEAVRGEGAKLLDQGGRRFVDELAPRDVVAKAIAQRLVAEGEGTVFLDLREIPPERFPNLFSALRESGLDPARQPVPVAPAAHYTVGGVVTDLDGRSTVPSLYAIGEAACTGLHGANRLASNSLSECFVFGWRAAQAALREEEPPSGPYRRALACALELEPAADLRRTLWEKGGLFRSAKDLEQLRESPHQLVRLIAACALAREESRGVHQRLDHPATNPALDRLHLCLEREGEPRWERW